MAAVYTYYSFDALRTVQCIKKAAFTQERYKRVLISLKLAEQEVSANIEKQTEHTSARCRNYFEDLRRHVELTATSDCGNLSGSTAQDILEVLKPRETWSDIARCLHEVTREFDKLCELFISNNDARHEKTRAMQQRVEHHSAIERQFQLAKTYEEEFGRKKWDWILNESREDVLADLDYGGSISEQWKHDIVAELGRLKATAYAVEHLIHIFRRLKIIDDFEPVFSMLRDIKALASAYYAYPNSSCPNGLNILDEIQGVVDGILKSPGNTPSEGKVLIGTRKTFVKRLLHEIAPEQSMDSKLGAQIVMKEIIQMLDVQEIQDSVCKHLTRTVKDFNYITRRSHRPYRHDDILRGFRKNYRGLKQYRKAPAGKDHFGWILRPGLENIVEELNYKGSDAEQWRLTILTAWSHMEAAKHVFIELYEVFYEFRLTDGCEDEDFDEDHKPHADPRWYHRLHEKM